MTMNKKVINILFFFISFFLIFNNVHKIIQINFLGGPVGNKLVFYPLFIGFIYTIYCQYKYENVLANFDKFTKFISVYLAITLISLIIGLYNYPYYDLVINGPVTQIEKLPKVIAFLDSLDIDIEENILVTFWMSARVIKGLFLEIIYTFGSAYMIYCWYQDNWKTAFNIMLKAISAALVFIFSYSVIEIFYLAGNQNAKEILEFITPYIHTVKPDGFWWPPLLWKNQLRSLFAEPSYYGIYFAFAMPVVWYSSLVAEKIQHKVLLYVGIIFFTFCLFITQARTAVALFLGEIVLFIIFLMFLQSIGILKKFAIIGLCSIIAFGMSNIFITNFMQPKPAKTMSVEISKDKSDKSVTKTDIKQDQKLSNPKGKQETNKIIIDKNQINSYFEKNLFSLASLNQRSNNARYSIMLTDLKIGLNNPILGVGTGLRNAYVPDYLPEMSKGNREVKMWLNNQKEKGIMRSGFPKLGEFTSRFAETGVLGLTIFLIPPLVLLRKLYFKISDQAISTENKLPYVFFTISLIGIMASGIGDTINITYCYWVLLGLGYDMCFGKEATNNLTNYKNNE